MNEVDGKVRFSTALPTDLHTKAKREAKEMGVSLNTVIFWAVREHVERREAEAIARVPQFGTVTP